MKQGSKEDSFRKGMLELVERSPVEEAIATRISYEDILTLINASVRRNAEYEAGLHQSWSKTDKPDPNEPTSPIDDVRAAVYGLESSISQMVWLAEEANTPLTVEHIKSMNPTDLAKRVTKIMFGASPEVPRLYTELDANARKVKR